MVDLHDSSYEILNDNVTLQFLSECTLEASLSYAALLFTAFLIALSGCTTTPEAEIF